MGSFIGWLFGREKRDDGRSGADWRRISRRRVATAWPPIEARIGKETAQVLDMTEKGFCLAIDEARAPSQDLATIFQGDEVLATGYAMRSWRGGSRVGYHFATGLNIERVQEQRSAKAAAAAPKRPSPLRQAETAKEKSNTGRKTATQTGSQTALPHKAGPQAQPATPGKTTKLEVAFPDETALRNMQEDATDAAGVDLRKRLKK